MSELQKMLDTWDRDLVLKVWPRGRIIMGLRTSKGILASLGKLKMPVKLSIFITLKCQEEELCQVLKPLVINAEITFLRLVCESSDNGCGNPSFHPHHMAQFVQSKDITRPKPSSVRSLATASVRSEPAAILKPWLLTPDLHFARLIQLCTSLEGFELLYSKGRTVVNLVPTMALSRALGELPKLSQLVVGQGEYNILFSFMQVMKGAAKCQDQLYLGLFDNSVKQHRKLFSSLTQLDLRENQISHGTMMHGKWFPFKDVEDALLQCPSISNLNLSRNRIESLENIVVQELKDGVDPVHHSSLNSDCEVLCPRLTSLDLSNNVFNPRNALHLGMVQHWTALRRLHLGPNYLGDEGITVIAQILSKLSSLTLLDLQSGQFGAKGLACLSESVPACPRLETVNLKSNRCDKASMAGTIAMLCKLPALADLDLSNYHLSFGLEGAASFISDESVSGSSEASANSLAFLRPWPNLQHLRLSHNSLGDDGVRILCRALKAQRCPSLATLDLSGNHISSEGVIHLSEALRRCSNLAILTLSHNPLMDQGVKDLASLLKDLVGLQVLDLSFTDFGDEGAGYLLSTITRVGGDEDPAEKLALMVLNMTNNHVSPEQASLLRQCNPHIRVDSSEQITSRSIGVSGNPF